MIRLGRTIAENVQAHTRTEISKLVGSSAEWRGVFNGPSAEILRIVFDVIGSTGMDAQLGSGELVTIPVLLQVDRLADGQTNPLIGQSGVCDHNHLLALRNSPQCPRFVALVSPGSRANLSKASTWSDFGLSAHNNSGAATITDWLDDPFICQLIDDGLQRFHWQSGQLDEARSLVQAAIRYANEIDNNLVARPSAWNVLARIWSISDTSVPFPKLLALACGFPPKDDGTVDVKRQCDILEKIASRAENGYGRALEDLLKGAAENEQLAVSFVYKQLQKRCDVPTALRRGMAHYYAPFTGPSIDSPPQWWSLLTVECWAELLQDENIHRGTIIIECANSILSQRNGITPVTRQAIELAIALPPEVDSAEVVVRREVGNVQNQREWVVGVNGSATIVDDDPPEHRTPIRYSATVTSDKTLRKGTIRVISLESWTPGFVLCGRTTSKATVPKKSNASKEKIDYEVSLLLRGEGRHYLDLYLRSGFVAGLHATAYDASGDEDEARRAPFCVVSESESGLEIEATSECYYEFDVVAGDEQRRVRVNLCCEEVAPQQCGSEFERLIRLNRARDDGRGVTAVHVDRQLRCSDLQSWMLDPDNAPRSFYPFVLGPDYAAVWSTRKWSSRDETTFAQGRFLNDPRPAPDEMLCPEEFVEARRRIASRIRAEDDETGVIEAARLGEWLSDSGFALDVETYLRSYLDWLESSPNTAAWCDVGAVCRYEADGSTLVQAPEAILISPLHPVRFAWHCIAQNALFLSQKKMPCPAASILDPGCVPDSLVLPLRTAAGTLSPRVFLAVECSSDYWSVLWNSEMLYRLGEGAGKPPFDSEFGVRIGSVSSGFSVSQVHRALGDILEILSAKPVLNILIASAAGQNNACNEGVVSWCKKELGTEVSDTAQPLANVLSRRLIQILDDRKDEARPEETQISNLAEDTGNSVRWFRRADNSLKPDLAIIAQLEASNASCESVRIASPLAEGGLIRKRIRQQLQGGKGAFISETRSAVGIGITGDVLADRTMDAIVRLENLGDTRYGYTFAPSVSAIESVMKQSDELYVAVSSAAVDPACFLGGWLRDSYLWDYELPSYSSRSGDSNGYYLISRVKEQDRESLGAVLSQLPDCGCLSREAIDQVILEVARRGIPTVRGFSAGNLGASGDLGLFIAARLLQDEFRNSADLEGILPIWKDLGQDTLVNLVIPVDPFRGYLDDLTRAIGKANTLRPDLLTAGIHLSPASITCRLTPIEVKFRGGPDPMSIAARRDALAQAKSLSSLLIQLKNLDGTPESRIWRLARQHLLTSMFEFAFRVYSQQVAVSNRSAVWSGYQQRVMEAILRDEMVFEIDEVGRTVVIDGSLQSAPRDDDEDNFMESVVLSRPDASAIVRGEGSPIYSGVKARIGTWGLIPSSALVLMGPNLKAESVSVSSQSIPEPSENRGDHEAASIVSSVGTLPDSELQPNLEPQGGVEILVGAPIDGFSSSPRVLNLSDTALNQLNIGVVGNLGTGKTQLLKSLVYQLTSRQAANNGVKPRMLIFDYKRDYSDELFVKATGARVLAPFNLPINLFDTSGPTLLAKPWLPRFQFFSDVLDKIYKGIGPVQRQQLRKAISDAYDQGVSAGRQPTIYDVYSNYQALVTKADSVVSIMQDMVDLEIFSSKPSAASSFDEFLDGVVVVSLADLGQDDRSKNMLVAVMLNLFYEHMLRIPKRPYFGSAQDRRVVDSFLLVDEADNIMQYEFDVLRKVLLQGREFGVGVILASQFLSHFKVGGTDYREPLLTWFVHKVPNLAAHELGALGLTGQLSEVAERIKTLGLHECYYKSHSAEGEFVRAVPFYKLLQEQARAATTGGVPS